jgi:hypothetical protein
MNTRRINDKQEVNLLVEVRDARDGCPGDGIASAWTDEQRMAVTCPQKRVGMILL